MPFVLAGGFAAQATVALVGAHAQPTAWARLLGAANALAQAAGGATFAWGHLPGARPVVSLRKRISHEGKWSAAYREGRTLPFTQVAALALRLLTELAQELPQHEAGVETALQPTQPLRRPDDSPITNREAEVLRLVALGRSSKAIGRELFLSPSTINQHVKAIFDKLGVATRAQAVAVATQRGLL